MLVHVPEHPNHALVEPPATTTGELVLAGTDVDHDVGDVTELTPMLHHSCPEVVVFLFPERLVVAALEEVALLEDHGDVIHGAASAHHLLDACIIQRQDALGDDVGGVTVELGDHTAHDAQLRVFLEASHLLLEAVGQADIVGVHACQVVVLGVLHSDTHRLAQSTVLCLGKIRYLNR